MIEVNVQNISKEHVDTWYQAWEQLNTLIFEAHEKRDGSAKQLMEQGIDLFQTFILNGSHMDEQVRTLDQRQTYELMPINGMERFAFIQMKPGQYACYRQLDELFKETKKRCARLRLKK